jgi:ribose transport system ATP-binding protein
VDIGAKEQIHQLIWDLAKTRGKAIVLISSDMPEIIRIASRILVFRDRRVVGEISGVDDGTRTYAEVSAAIGRYLN